MWDWYFSFAQYITFLIRLLSRIYVTNAHGYSVCAHTYVGHYKIYQQFSSFMTRHDLQLLKQFHSNLFIENKESSQLEKYLYTLYTYM